MGKKIVELADDIRHSQADQVIKEGLYVKKKLIMENELYMKSKLVQRNMDNFIPAKNLIIGE